MWAVRHKRLLCRWLCEHHREDSFRKRFAIFVLTRFLCLKLQSGVTFLVNERWVRGTPPSGILGQVQQIKEWALKVVVVICHADSFEVFCKALVLAGIAPGSITILVGNPAVLVSYLFFPPLVLFFHNSDPKFARRDFWFRSWNHRRCCPSHFNPSKVFFVLFELSCRVTSPNRLEI